MSYYFLINKSILLKKNAKKIRYTKEKLISWLKYALSILNINPKYQVSVRLISNLIIIRKANNRHHVFKNSKQYVEMINNAYFSFPKVSM